VVADDRAVLHQAALHADTERHALLRGGVEAGVVVVGDEAVSNGSGRQPHARAAVPVPVGGEHRHVVEVVGDHAALGEGVGAVLREAGAASAVGGGRPAVVAVDQAVHDGAAAVEDARARYLGVGRVGGDVAVGDGAAGERDAAADAFGICQPACERDAAD
jgi:hypothetical protein